MIVVLHGMPGEEGKKTLYDTGFHSFKDTLEVAVVFMPPFSLTDPCEQEAPAFKHGFLMFSYSHFDGTYHNYTLIEESK